MMRLVAGLVAGFVLTLTVALLLGSRYGTRNPPLPKKVEIECTRYVKGADCHPKPDR